MIIMNSQLIVYKLRKRDRLIPIQAKLKLKTYQN